MTKKEALKLVKPFLKKHKIRHYIHWKIDGQGLFGYAKSEKGIVVIFPKNLSTEHFLSTIFHEVAHVLCYRKNIYKEYNGGLSAKCTKAQYTKWAKQALKAEKLADIMGKRLMKQVTNHSYIANYSNPKYVKGLQAYIMQVGAVLGYE